MNKAKIQFSAEESSLMEDVEFILTKNRIINKICDFFGGMIDDMKNDLQKVNLPVEIKLTTAKISKGENYKGLPWVVLDYPRLFTKENIFAIRTLFWWGNYFSVTLHLKGKYKEIFSPLIQKNLQRFLDHDFYISISDDEWHHALHEGHYSSISKLNSASIKTSLSKNDFLKLSAKIDLTQWQNAEEKLIRLFEVILGALE